MKLTEQMAAWSLVTVLVKFLLAGVAFKMGHFDLTFGPIDGVVIAAILTPTLGAPHLEEYVKGKQKNDAS